MRGERELLERCLGEDHAAWEDLVQEHTGRVYRLCYRFTRKHSEAQELTQDVFLRVFQTLASFRSAEATFGGWLIRLTRNLLIDHYRRTSDDRATWSLEEHPGIEEDLVSQAEHPDESLSEREVSDLLNSSLAILSPTLREPIVFRDLKEMSYRETAQALGVPEGTVKSRLNRGHAELARRMRKYQMAV
jgi:RNA polymerase sigma-70 factor (ECF subfamily)